jgi:hypothetical protein
MEGKMKKFNSEQGAKEFAVQSGKAQVVIINNKRAKVDITLLIKRSRKDKKRSSSRLDDTENASRMT